MSAGYPLASRRILSLLMFVCLCSAASAQRAREMTSQAAAQLGLERAWSTSIPIARGENITGVDLVVSANDSYEAREIVDKFGRRSYFSERQVDPSTVDKIDEIERLTEIKVANLKARGMEPTVEKKTIPSITMYIRGSNATLVSLDAESGLEKWTSVVGTPGHPTYATSATDEHVVTLSGITMYLLRTSDGLVVSTKTLNTIPGATPSILGNRVFAPTWRGLVQVYTTDNFTYPDYTLGSDGRINHPVTLTPQSVSWTTEKGFLYVADPRSPGVRFRFQALEGIATSPVYKNGTLYAPSLDGFVYAIDERTGDAKWRYSSGEPISNTPLAVDNDLYVITDYDNLICMDVEQGTARWTQSSIQRFLAASEQRLYCVTTGNRLTVIDRATGGRIADAEMSLTTLPLVNTVTDRIYLVGKNGALQCLREVGRRWPDVKVDPIVMEPDSEPTIETPDAPTTSPDTPARPPVTSTPDDGGDPFGMDDAGGAGADPFGIDAGGAEPAEEEPAIDPGTDDGGAADDPFGFDDFGAGGDAGDAEATDDPFAPF